MKKTLIKKFNERRKNELFFKNYMEATERFHGRTVMDEVMYNYSRIVIPANLDLGNLVRRILWEAEPDNQLEGLLGTLIELLIRAKAHYPGSVDKEGYTNLHDTLVHIDFPAFEQLYPVLERQHIVQLKKLSKASGKYSYAYRLAPAYSSVGLKTVVIDHPEVLNLRFKLGLRNISDFTFFPEMFSFLASSRFRVDVDGLFNYLEEYYRPEHFTETPTQVLTEDKEKWMYRIYELAHKHLMFKVDELSMEVYTSLAPFIARRALRPFVSYDNTPLVELCVKESRLLFVSIALDYNFWNFEPGFALFLKGIADPSEKTLAFYSSKSQQAFSVSYNQYRRLFLTSKQLRALEPTKASEINMQHVTGYKQYIESLYDTPLTSDTAKALVSLFGLGDDKREGAEEIIRYKALASHGKLINHLLGVYYNETGETFESLDDQQLDFAELLLYSQFEDENELDVALAIQGAFALEFPLIFELFDWLKLNNRLLPNLAYKLQSLVYLEKICDRVTEESPNIFIFPLSWEHSPTFSIATIEGNEKYISKVVQEEIYKSTGASCLLRKTYWRHGDSLQGN